MGSMAAVAEVLGGRKILGAKPKTALEWQEVILAGMPVGSAEALKGGISVADKPFAELIGISEKTLSRARSGRARLDPVASDRLYRLAKIVTWTKEPLVSSDLNHDPHSATFGIDAFSLTDISTVRPHPRRSSGARKMPNMMASFGERIRIGFPEISSDPLCGSIP